MINRAQASHQASTGDGAAELAALATQITNGQAAINRYHAAFENGTMDDAVAGPRIRELRHRLTQLQARHAQLADELDRQPAPPPPSTIARIREHLTEIMSSGTTTERKAAIETLIHEVRLTAQGAVPVFKIPTETTMPPPEPGEGTRNEQPTVRTMVRSVEPRLRHTNSLIMAQGCDLEVPLVGERSPALLAPGRAPGVVLGDS